jgi:asparagine synthase (glutamine-hydrolysing)
VDLLPRLNGMFAFALLDLRENTRGCRLLLARDRFGIKPLYYCKRGERLLFASEIKSVLQDASVSAELNLESLHRYLSFLWVPGPATMFSGIEQLPPAHYLSWDGRDVRVKPYWELKFKTDESMKADTATEELRAILRRAVQRHLISDVPVGVFLSGGLDSSSILALSSAENSGGRKAYTIAYRAEDAELEQSADDPKHARRVAQQFKADYHEIEVSPDIVELLPKVVWHLDTPVADPAAISTYLICKAAQPELKVLLSGQGADEIFAGYRVHMADRLARRVASIPAFFRDRPGQAVLFLLHATKDHLPGVRPGLAMAAHRFLSKTLANASLDPVDRYVLSRSYLTQPDLCELYSRELRLELGESSASREYHDYFREVEGEDFVNRMLYVDAKTFLPDLNLAYCDKLSSAASVETRVPFLDCELTEFMERVPPRLKLKGLTGKYILRRAMKGLLPDEVLHRRKAAFGAPIRRWLRQDLRSMVDDLLSEETIRRRGLFNPQTIRRMVTADREGKHDHAYRVWALVTLETWQRTFLDRTADNWEESSPAMDREREIHSGTCT